LPRSLAHDLALEQLEIAEHRRQQVVEVVRNAAGELSHRLHLLRLSQLLFEAARIGEVDRGAEDPLHGAVGSDERNEDRAPDDAPHRQLAHEFVLERAPGRRAVAVFRIEESRIARREDLVRCLADHLLGRKSGQPQKGRVHIFIDEPAVGEATVEEVEDRRGML
jgi:hypothetical protein